METYELRKWIVDNKVETEIINFFDTSFEYYKTDCMEEFQYHFPDFDQKALSKYLYKVSLTLIGWGESEQECIIASLRIKYNNSYIGEYRLVYSLDGNILDDYLVIE